MKNKKITIILLIILFIFILGIGFCAGLFVNTERMQMINNKKENKQDEIQENSNKSDNIIIETEKITLEAPITWENKYEFKKLNNNDSEAKTKVLNNEDEYYQLYLTRNEKTIKAFELMISKDISYMNSSWSVIGIYNGNEYIYVMQNFICRDNDGQNYTKEDYELESEIGKVINSLKIKSKGISSEGINNRMTADERFEYYSIGVQSEIEKLGSQSVNLSETEKFTPQISGDIKGESTDLIIGDIYINHKKEVYVSIKELGDQIKIFDNAIDCGICESGNGGVLFVIWAIDVNGDLYTRNYDIQDTANKMNFTLTKQQNLKNIVSVAQEMGLSAGGPVCFDIEGKMHRIN